MSSPSFIGYPHLPPTTNTLDSYQRLRLIRSTRKLGAVLGTTPCLVENDASFVLLPLGKATSKSSKRQGSIFTHNQSSSLSVTSSVSTSSSHYPSPSASSITLPCTQSSEPFPPNPPGLYGTTRKRRPGDKVPQLYLQINPIPVPPTDNRLAPELPLSPCTPTPLTPTTPSVPDAAEVRRKRMAKLARHLGEHIPAELVLASDSAPKPVTTSPDRPPRRRSQSVHVRRTEVATLPEDRANPGRPRQDWVGEWNRSNIKDVQKELRGLRTR